MRRYFLEINRINNVGEARRYLSRQGPFTDADVHHSLQWHQQTQSLQRCPPSPDITVLART